MTRGEEIQKLIDEETGIDNYGSLDYQIGVCDGVRLADKTMLEKAREQLSIYYPNIDRMGIDAFIEHLKKQWRNNYETMGERKYDDLRLEVDQDDKLATEVTIEGNKITPPKNYLIGKITKVDNGMIVEFVKKKPQYPKNYKKCCQIVGGIASERHLQYDTIPSYKFEEDLRDSLETLRKLLICRDAYWKIAGEQMGLDRPWESDWGENDGGYRYCIHNQSNKIILSNEWLGENYILSFPTEEMRDAFYENFKDLIEHCKELL